MFSTWARVVLVAAVAGLHTGAGEIGVFEAAITRATKIRYLVQLPKDYHVSKNAAWPLLVYLHGGSARGSDIELVKRYGPPAAASKSGDFPFVLLSPQCPEGEIWTDADGLIAMIAHVQKQYRIDPRRIYLTGISMGGRGVLYLASKHTATFAAVAALAPYAPITDWAGGLASTPVLILHGDNDSVAPIHGSKELAGAITKSGGDVDFKVLAGKDHYIADLYNGRDIYAWLLKRRR